MNEDQPPSRRSRGFFQQINDFFSKQNSKEDLREYLQEAQDNNIIDNEEAAMMEGVLAVYEQRVRDVMLPKTKMVTVSEGMNFDDTVAQVLASGHSRFPVAQDDQIVGILLAKDLLGHPKQPDTPFSITRFMRPVYQIPESKPLDAMLREFRLNRQHMAIVTNEYGEVAGLVTIEDVIEEIVGEIDDEHDAKEAKDIKKLDDNLFLVSALTEIDDFNDFFHTALDTDTNDTIGGLVLSHFGYVPKVNEKIAFSGLQFVIKNANDRRILDIHVSYT